MKSFTAVILALKKSYVIALPLLLWVAAVALLNIKRMQLGQLGKSLTVVVIVSQAVWFVVCN